jgi:integrase/recombinase XerD
VFIRLYCDTMVKSDSDSMNVSSYLNELKINGISKPTLEYYTSVLKDANSFKKLPNWNRDDVNSYFLSLNGKNKQSSIELKKIVIKKFVTWAGKNESVAHLKVKIQKNNLKREDLLTVEDIDKLIETTDSPLWKAIIAFLFESGCRIGEAVSIKVKDTQETDKGLIVNIPTTKTEAGYRRTLLVYSATYIRNHINYSALSKDDLLFGVGDEWVRIMLSRLAKKAGITKPVNPHKFRHSSATYACLKGYNEEIIRKKYGWSANSTVPSRYFHLIDEDVIDATLEKEGLDITKSRTFTNIKQAESLKIADASMQLSKLSEENEELKTENRDRDQKIKSAEDEIKNLRQMLEEAQHKYSDLDRLHEFEKELQDLRTYTQSLQKILYARDSNLGFAGGKIVVPDNKILQTGKKTA